MRGSVAAVAVGRGLATAGTRVTQPATRTGEA